MDIWGRAVAALMKYSYNKKQSDGSLGDDLLFPAAATVRAYYAGYPSVIKWEPGGEYDFASLYAELDNAKNWCTENCIGKWATHIHRVSNSRQNDSDWEFDEFGGGDHCFWGFENEDDALLFSLRW